MGNTKSLVLVITSLIFLVWGAVCNQLSVLPVYAAPPHLCFNGDCPGFYLCSNDGVAVDGKLTCCWKEPGVIPSELNCQTCDVDPNGYLGDCSAASKGKPGPGIIAPPPVGVAPPPLTETCPENTVRDANGNCTPLTQTPEEPSPEGPTELTPEVDCNQTPDDPLCETARIPEAGDGDSDGGGDDAGEDSSSDGGNEDN